MTEYQASNIAVEDTENSTLIEPCINIDSTLNKRYINIGSTLIYVTLIQCHFSTSIQLSNPTKIQRLFNVDGQLKFNVVSTLMCLLGKVILLACFTYIDIF